MTYHQSHRYETEVGGKAIAFETGKGEFLEDRIPTANLY